MQVNIIKNKQMIARVVVLFASAVMFALFYHIFETKSEEYSSLNAKLGTQIQRFKTLSDTTKLAAEYESKFTKYMPVKQYETENRLAWIDMLQTIRKKHKIPGINFSFSKQQPYDYKDGLIKHRGLKVSVTDIKVSMKLMHEAELISVIKDIKKITPSIHLLNSCELKRLKNSKGVSVNRAVANIDALCHIKWFTFRVI